MQNVVDRAASSNTLAAVGGSYAGNNCVPVRPLAFPLGLHLTEKDWVGEHAFGCANPNQVEDVEMTPAFIERDA